MLTERALILPEAATPPVFVSHLESHYLSAAWLRTHLGHRGQHAAGQAIGCERATLGFEYVVNQRVGRSEVEAAAHALAYAMGASFTVEEVAGTEGLYSGHCEGLARGATK